MAIFIKNNRILVVALIMSFILSGCLNRQTPEEKIFTELEKVVAAEKVFEEQQTPLVELEKKEKELYEEIISLGMKEYDRIVQISDEALQNVAARKEHMNKEQESIKESEEEFKDVNTLIEDIEEASVKEQATLLYETMIERYKTHNSLYELYSQGLGYDKELYEMFKQKELTLDQLEEQIIKINETYEKVLEANNKFNELTDQYNDQKLEFYKLAGIEIKE